MIPNYNPFTLVGKTVLVTGASAGIGKAIAVECSKMGATVIASGRNECRLRETLDLLEGENHSMVVADISSASDIESMVQELPILNGVVHCAGIGNRALCKQIKEQDIANVMSSNFSGPVLLQRALMKAKKIAKNGSIVMIASRAPFAPAIGNALYSASKGALIAYSKVLGLELAPMNIRVNAIAPAMVWTELIKKDAELTGTDLSESEKKYPLKRYGKPEDIAYLSIYLLSDASSWMTGSCIDITGGANSL